MLDDPPDAQSSAAPESEPPDEAAAAPSVLLTAPRGGVPPVVATDEALVAVATRLARVDGPVAVDAERASGYRYSQRAYLIQLRRGTETVLLDPIGIADMAPLQTAIGEDEWILHAASQDLPCLREVGLSPPVLFDTELAGRLLGLERVGLAALLERELGVTLAKEHSAADWSTRPLPPSWLTYAALDVELLVELRDALDSQLEEAGKREWAQQEFEHVRLAPATPPREEPWRRTSGIHRVHDRRALAVIKECWYLRDTISRDHDTAPGRLLPDASIVSLASAAREIEVTAVPGFVGRGAKRYARQWAEARRRAYELVEAELPTTAAHSDGPPHPRVWLRQNPPAAARLNSARESLAKVAAEVTMPIENVLSPAAVRDLAWTPPEPVDAGTVAIRLAARGARAWQIGLTAEPIAAALLA